MFHLQSQWSPETHLLSVRSAWDTSAWNPSISFLWRNAPRIWRDFGSALPFQTRLTQTKPALPLSNEQVSPVNDQSRRQCCQNQHKNFPYRPTRDVSLLSVHASYIYYLQHIPDVKFHTPLLLTQTNDSTINLLNTFDNRTITLGVTRLQPCCHSFSCPCSSCSVANLILIMFFWVTAYRVSVSHE
jgi:hypothetical protein